MGPDGVGNDHSVYGGKVSDKLTADYVCLKIQTLVAARRGVCSIADTGPSMKCVAGNWTATRSVNGDWRRAERSTRQRNGASTGLITSSFYFF